MTSGREKSGAFICREREAREIGLREMAKLIGVSPPTCRRSSGTSSRRRPQDRVRTIAKIVECDTDDLLARAGRASTEITDIIKRHPGELAALLRTTKRLTAEDIARLARDSHKANGK